MKKEQIALSDQLMEDIKQEQSRHIQLEAKFYNIPSIIKMLLKEALSLRRKYPDVIQEVVKNRMEYDAELYGRGDLSVFTLDAGENEKPVTSRRKWTKMKVDGIPLSLHDVVEAIRKLDNYAHTIEIAHVLGMKMGSVQSRIVRAMDKHLIRRLDWGVYTCVIPADPFAPTIKLTPKEEKALARAQQWVKKSRGLEL